MRAPSDDGTDPELSKYAPKWSREQPATPHAERPPLVSTRFQGKEALFIAVVMRNVAALVGPSEGHIPTGESIDERHASVGATVLHWALVDDTVDLMRVGISEARRFPDLANNVHRMARGRAEEIVTWLMAEVARSDALGALPAFAPQRLATTAQFFMDLVFLPMIMRALFGEKLKPLRAEIGQHLARSVTFFLTACRHGGVN